MLTISARYKSLTAFPHSPPLNSITSIDVSNNAIVALPNDINEYSNLSSLRANNNKIESIPPTIGGCSTLTSLSLNSNEISSVPDSLGCLNNLKELELAWNKISYVPVTLSNISSLTNLDLSANRFLFFPNIVLPGLKLLNLRSNNFESFPDSILSFTNLLSLNLSNNFISSIPENMGKLTKLNKIDLSFNEVTNLSPLNLPTLSICIISYNGLKSISNSFFSSVPLMKEFVCGSNEVQSIDTSISLCKNLRKIDLSHNRLINLPKNFCQLQALTSLDISHNFFETLPSDLSQLSALTNLIVEKNKLSSLPNAFPALCEINLKGNFLTKIPNALFAISSLTSVNISSNLLSEIPPEISSVKNLLIFDASFNKLSSFPQLPSNSLTTISLSFNSLVSIPSFVSAFKSLKTLLLGFNLISEIPSNLSECKTLTELNLSGNKIANITPSFFSNFTELRILALSGNPLSLNSNKGLPNMTIEDLDLESCSLTEAFFDAFSDNSVPNLKHINFSNNQLTVFPVFLSKIKIEEIWANNNRFTEFPSDMISSASLKILSIQHNKISTVPKLSCKFLVHNNECFNSVTALKKNVRPTRIFEAYQSTIAGRRPDNQDCSCVLSQPSNDLALAAVFDGHSGIITAQYCAVNLPFAFQRAFEMYSNNHTALAYTFAELQDGIHNNSLTDGTTAVVVLITGNTLTVAHVGDSRAVLCKGQTAIALTNDHKPTGAEKTRIYEAGSFLCGSRVRGDLAVTRALGDPLMKPFVSALPDVAVYNIEPNDEFVILACDGVWDVLNEQEAVNIVLSAPRAESALYLRSAAYHLGSTDNITVVVFFLR